MPTTPTATNHETVISEALKSLLESAPFALTVVGATGETPVRSALQRSAHYWVRMGAHQPLAEDTSRHLFTIPVQVSLSFATARSLATQLAAQQIAGRVMNRVINLASTLTGAYHRGRVEYIESVVTESVDEYLVVQTYEFYCASKWGA